MTAALPMTASYDPSVVLVSILIATLASYVALDLADRVRRSDPIVARYWWIGGSLAMGSGIWAMHFVGMLAFSLPIALGYTKGLTVVSWIAAVGVSAAALSIASRRRLSRRNLVGGALFMGAGICAMHYLGMAAIDVMPGIAWDPWWVTLSVVIAVAASGAALSIFFWLRQASRMHGRLFQALAAVVMGLAVSGMHYSGMAAASFPEGTVCLSAGSLAGNELGALVTLAAVLLLAMTLLTSILDARAQTQAALLASSLQSANAQLQAANSELQERAFRDPLTNLPNRKLFEDRLGHAVARLGRAEQRIGARPPSRLAVLFVDLDGFKAVNDSLGHAAGDRVLMEAAARLRDGARDADTVARIGGDEFVVLMEDVTHLADCVNIARRLLTALAQPIEIAGQPVMISGSIGIVLHPDHGQPDKLIAHADAAMYAAKRAGGNTYSVFESGMDAGANDQLQLQQDLRQALQRQQMQLHYQPKVDSRRGQIIGVEALLRWNHPERGMVGPLEFIPIAERFGLIGALGQWVIDEACRQMRVWADEGLRMRVAINVSVHQLREEDLVERISQALQRHRVEPSQLLCEITESVAMEDIKATQRAFDGLARIGVFLSIDDFGTGYSSLSYLRQLPARQLKIDRSFVKDLEASADARAVVDAVVRLAHALGLQVVAEGVETEGQRDVLLALDCDELQGYFFARPMAAQSLMDWVRERQPGDPLQFSASLLLEPA